MGGGGGGGGGGGSKLSVIMTLTVGNMICESPLRREKERKTKRISAWLFSKDCSGVMKMSWREN